MSLTQAMTEVEADAICVRWAEKVWANIPETVFGDSTYRRCTPDTDQNSTVVPADLLGDEYRRRALDTEDAQARLCMSEYPGVADAQVDIARLRQLALAVNVPPRTRDGRGINHNCI